MLPDRHRGWIQQREPRCPLCEPGLRGVRRADLLGCVWRDWGYHDRQSVPLRFLLDVFADLPTRSDSQIPNAVNIGRQDCLKKCGINENTFNIVNVRPLSAHLPRTS